MRFFLKLTQFVDSVFLSIVISWSLSWNFRTGIFIISFPVIQTVLLWVIKGSRFLWFLSHFSVYYLTPSINVMYITCLPITRTIYRILVLFIWVIFLRFPYSTLSVCHVQLKKKKKKRTVSRCPFCLTMMGHNDHPISQVHRKTSGQTLINNPKIFT